MSDSDRGDLPSRSPYARPVDDASTESRNYLVESPPEPADPAADLPAGVSVAPAPVHADDGDGRATRRRAQPGVAERPLDSASDGAQPSAADAAQVVPAVAPLGAAALTAQPDVRPRAVQVSTSRRGPRRARLVIKHVDPWTVMKISFVVSLVMLVVIVVAVAIIYGVLGKMGVWDQINTFVNALAPTTTSSALRTPLTASRVITVSAVIGAINVVLMTALSTLGAAIYNLISDLVGGVEVTLTDP